MTDEDRDLDLLWGLQEIGMFLCGKKRSPRRAGAFAHELIVEHGMPAFKIGKRLWAAWPKSIINWLSEREQAGRPEASKPEPARRKRSEAA